MGVLEVIQGRTFKSCPDSSSGPPPGKNQEPYSVTYNNRRNNRALIRISQRCTEPKAQYITWITCPSSLLVMIQFTFTRLLIPQAGHNTGKDKARAFIKETITLAYPQMCSAAQHPRHSSVKSSK